MKKKMTITDGKKVAKVYYWFYKGSVIYDINVNGSHDSAIVSKQEFIKRINNFSFN